MNCSVWRASSARGLVLRPFALVLSSTFAFVACTNDSPNPIGPHAGDVTAPSLEASASTRPFASVSAGGQCLTIRTPFASGSIAEIQPCDGRAGQQFTLQPDGTIQLRDEGMCLDDYGALGNDGDQIGLWHCNGGDNQK